MSMVAGKGLTVQFGGKVVLDNISFELRPNETAGLIGTNGAGKTTLLRLIARELTADMGTIEYARGLRIGYLKQEPGFPPDGTLYEIVATAFTGLLEMEAKLHTLSEQIAEHADSPKLSQYMADYDRVHERFIAAGGQNFETRLHEILSGLGFTQSDYAMPVSVMSGGQRSRAALARVLLEDCPLLLFDEPTNHLDIDAVRWLEKFLSAHRGGAVVVSHDRYLLDRLCDRVIEVENTRVRSFPGNYSNYAATRARRELEQQRQFEKDGEFIKKERAFIAKHLAGQRTAEAKGRRTRLERRLSAGEFVLDAPSRKRSAAISFARNPSTEGTVLRCDELSMAYGEKRLFADLTFQVASGDRLGITGPNGTGKTTLLRIILDEVQPTGGETTLDPKQSVGYYAQDRTDLDPSHTAVEAIMAGRGDLTEAAARSYLARFLFTGDNVFDRVETLSGGEQSRLRLAKLILDSPDVLILDEPTNHLDIPSREALEEALIEFGGTIIAVSHDRYFLDRVAQRMLVMRPNECTMVAGNYSDYLAQTQRDAEATQSTRPKRGGRDRSKGRGEDQPDEKTGPSPYDRLSVDELERMVIDREVSLAALQERFGDPAVCSNPDALAELKEEMAAVEQELSAIDAAWQERAEHA